MNPTIRLFILLSLSFIVVKSYSQTGTSVANSNKSKADRLYEKDGYMAANKLYSKELNTKNESPDLFKKLAESYRLNGLNKDAEANYARFISPSSNPEDLLHYAQVLLYNGKCKEAVEYFNYYRLKADKDQINHLISSCDELSGLAFRDNIEYMNAEGLNSPYLDFSPVYYKNGLIFTSGRDAGSSSRHIDSWTAKEFPDVYYAASKGNGKFDKPELLSWNLKTKYNDGAVTFNPDGTEMYYSSNNRNGKSKAGIKDLKIYIAKLKNGVWVNEGSFPFNNNDYAVCHPALSPNGKVMVFASDMPNGFGGMDLYVCKKNEAGVWSNPLNLGKEINTAGNEIFPFIDNKGELFFSSDGLKGLGGLDIFSANAAETDMHWVTPTNLGLPFNSNKDDLCYISATGGHEGYFTSNREGGVGEDDIYYWREKSALKALETPKPLSVISLTVKDKDTKAVIKDAKINLYNQYSEPISFTSDDNGNISRPINPDEFKFGIFEKQGYKTVNQYISPDMADNPEKSTVYMEKAPEPPAPIADNEDINKKKGLTKKYLGNDTGNFKEGNKFELKDIYYDYDKFFIRPDAAVNLDELISLLNTYPGMVIELSSHTDSRGKTDYNQDLSQARADAAKAYIVNKGIDAARIISKGYGETQLKNRCKDGVDCTEEEHQENRRTEVKILKM